MWSVKVSFGAIFEPPTMRIWGELFGDCGGNQDLSQQSKASGDTGNRHCLGSTVEFNSRI